MYFFIDLLFFRLKKSTKRFHFYLLPSCCNLGLAQKPISQSAIPRAGVWSRSRRKSKQANGQRDRERSLVNVWAKPPLAVAFPTQSIRTPRTCRSLCTLTIKYVWLPVVCFFNELRKSSWFCVIYHLFGQRGKIIEIMGLTGHRHPSKACHMLRHLVTFITVGSDWSLNLYSVITADVKRTN